MNTYEQKQEDRRQRYLDRAGKATAEAKTRFARSDQMADAMGGTPILIGHHSEKRHRRDIDRMHNDMRRGIAANDKAAHYAGKAASVGKAGISSDDPEAVVKLLARIAKLEKDQADMVAVNKLVRKKDRAGLAAMGYTEAVISGFFTPDFMGRVGFPGYALTNNSGNIRRLKKRLEQLERAADRETVEHDPVDGVRLIENAELNRVQLIFDAKPPAEVRRQLKLRGFRWSPTEGAWQRHLTSGAWQAKDFLDWLHGASTDEKTAAADA